MASRKCEYKLIPLQPPTKPNHSVLLHCSNHRTLEDSSHFYRCRNIFALQQNLTNITMSREGDLDHARTYYELLYNNPEVTNHTLM